jgi:hypothetical protein
VIEDLSNPDIWFKEADPKQHKAVEVTEEDLTHAVTVMVTKKTTCIHHFSFSHDFLFRIDSKGQSVDCHLPFLILLSNLPRIALKVPRVLLTHLILILIHNNKKNGFLLHLLAQQPCLRLASTSKMMKK